MNRSTISGKQFDRHPKKARKAADKGPVFIREGCRNSFVLLTIEEYRKIGGKAESILDLIPTPANPWRPFRSSRRRTRGTASFGRWISPDTSAAWPFESEAVRLI